GVAAGQTLYVSASAASDPACAVASQANPFATIAGALSCASGGATIQLGSGTFAGGFTVGRSVTIQGTGSSSLIAGPAAPLMTQPEVTVAGGLTVTLKNVTVEGGGKQTDVVAGRGVLNVVNSTIRGGVGDSGAGIRVSPPSGKARLMVLRSTIADNVSFGQGGGIYVSNAAVAHSVDV